MSDKFSVRNVLKERKAFSSLLFDFVLEYAIRKWKREMLKLSGIYDISFCSMLMTLIDWLKTYTLKTKTQMLYYSLASRLVCDNR